MLQNEKFMTTVRPTCIERLRDEAIPKPPGWNWGHPQASFPRYCHSSYPSNLVDPTAPGWQKSRPKKTSNLPEMFGHMLLQITIIVSWIRVRIKKIRCSNTNRINCSKWISNHFFLSLDWWNESRKQKIQKSKFLVLICQLWLNFKKKSKFKKLKNSQELTFEDGSNLFFQNQNFKKNWAHTHTFYPSQTIKILLLHKSKWWPYANTRPDCGASHPT